MFIASIILVALTGTSAVLGHPLGPSNTRRSSAANHRRVCASFVTPEEVAAAEKHFASHRIAHNAKTAANATVEVEVVFHVISKDDTPAGGNVFDDQIAQQIDVLNKDYKSTNLVFKLTNTTRTVNEEWFDTAAPESDIQTELKNKLRIGGPETLNVYSVGFTNVSSEYTGLLGYSTFPRTYESAPKDDGVVFRFSTMPGGESVPFDLGRTLTHETGHWLGLYHTFQGGCEGTGDSVADTPPEAEANFECKTRDTCPDSKGNDAIHNFMNYSPDACLTEFTPGQTVRLRSQIETYRNLS